MRKIKRPNVRAVRAGPPLDMLSDRVSLSHEGDVLPPPLSGRDWPRLGLTGLQHYGPSDWSVCILSRATILYPAGNTGTQSIPQLIPVFKNLKFQSSNPGSYWHTTPHM